MSAPGLTHFDYNYEILEAAASRWNRRRAQREENLIKVATHRLDEVESPERLAANEFYEQRAPHPPVRALLAGVEREASEAMLASFALERVIGDRDFLGIAFLETAMAMARFVGRVHVRSRPGTTLGYGTGFMVSPRLLLTNNHVLPTPDVAQNSEVQFDYQRDRAGQLLPVAVYGLKPAEFYLTDPDLDFTLVAVQAKSFGGLALGGYTWVRLRAPSGKALLGDPLNIIQHPRGEVKQIVLRSNRLVNYFDDLVQYETDTEPGSSGSPVFSDNWNVVALHHSGVPKTNEQGQFLDVHGNIWVKGRDDPDRLAWVGNEGIRISSIIKHLEEAKLDSPAKLELRRQLLEDEPRHPLDLLVPGSTPPRETTPHAGAFDSTPGSVTLTIPLNITVSLGSPVGSVADGLQPTTTIGPAPTATLGETPSSAPIDVGAASTGDPEATLDAAKRELASPQVLGVELGYVFRNGWITDERALVVTVLPERGSRRPLGASAFTLPGKFRGMPVEVVGPSILDLIRQARGEVATEALFDAGIGAEEITYVPPGDVVLSSTKKKMRVVAHVSPDAGWAQLSRFLAATRGRLVVGMYDFGAPHIVEAVEALKSQDFEGLTLLLQKGESVGTGTKIDDLRDADVVARLAAAFGARFQQAWVKIGPKSGWVASSYHIKVAVRDRQAIWLSSGNWQSSNQPKAEPLREHPRRKHWLQDYNREWHAIVEHAELARIFEAHLLNDYQHNVGGEGADELDLPDILVPEALLELDAVEAITNFRYFAPFDENRVFTVLPLLTPDNYHENVLQLIESASEELLIQNQTFNAPKESHEQLRGLVEAVRAKQQQGVAVRIIFRFIPEDATGARKNLEALKAMGFDMADFRLQKNCHTKGIIVDRKRVLLGSQNWSNDGVSVNRDASLLFDDAELARYFGAIFDHDWEVLAKQNIGLGGQPLELAPVGEATPEGMVRLRWKEYTEIL